MDLLVFRIFWVRRNIEWGMHIKYNACMCMGTIYIYNLRNIVFAVIF